MKQKKQNEFKHLQNLSSQFSSFDGFNSFLIKRRYQHLAQFFVGTTCLELGSADGMGTHELYPHFETIVALDGSQEYIDALKKRYTSKVEPVCSLIEKYTPKKKFDTVVLAHVLEHVDQPVEILKKIKSFVKPGGRCIIDVPNATSLHRMAGVKMGLLTAVTDLNEGDKRIGHRRVYTPTTLKQDTEQAGFVITHSGGMFIKPLANDQIAEHWSPELIEAYFIMGEDFPDIASEIYVVCTI